MPRTTADVQSAQDRRLEYLRTHEFTADELTTGLAHGKAIAAVRYGNNASARRALKQLALKREADELAEQQRKLKAEAKAELKAERRERRRRLEDDDDAA